MKRALFTIGTRPELIKLYPLIKEFEANNIAFDILASGQHIELLKPYWEIFKVKPDFELKLRKNNQSLSELSARGIQSFQDFLDSQDNKYDLLIAQGDTTTVMISSMVAFYNRIEFAHIEAGLRSHNLDAPFPEEYNRKVASIASSYHFAPTELAKENLLNEGVDEKSICVTGNTVVDTIKLINTEGLLQDHQFNQKELLELSAKVVLITCHRRENHDDLEELIDAIEILANDHMDISFVWPVHPNPNVYTKVMDSRLSAMKNVLICEPLDYFDLNKLLYQTIKIISDSGGLQEEAPSYGIPVLVLRDITERPEAIDSGLSILVGMNKDKIINGFVDFNPDNTKKYNPYGDGKASTRILNRLK